MSLTSEYYASGGFVTKPVTTKDNKPQYVTVAEMATILAVSKMTIYRMVHNEELPSIRVGRSIRIPARAAGVFLNEGTVDGPAPAA